MNYQKQIILNVSSPDGVVPAATLSMNLLEVMNQLTIAESLMKANAIMKKAGVRVNISLVLLKSLMSGDWSKKDSDDPTELSILFLGWCTKNKNEEHLHL